MEDRTLGRLIVCHWRPAERFKHPGGWYPIPPGLRSSYKIVPVCAVCGEQAVAGRPLKDWLDDGVMYHARCRPRQ